MKIAVLDDGIKKNVFKSTSALGDVILNNVFYKNNKYINHGTICAAILKKYSVDSDIINVKILDEKTQVGSTAQLYQGLKWCLDNNIPLINLSLGIQSLYDYEYIKDIVNEIVKNGQIIVSARANNGYFSIPADLGGVISVSANTAFAENTYIISNNSISTFEAAGTYQLKQINDKIYKSESCNSFATPYITALISNLMQASPKFKLTDIRQSLYISKHKIKSINLIEQKPNFFNSAVVIDFSNSFNNYLPFFKIERIYEESDISNIKLFENTVIVIIPSEKYNLSKLMCFLATNKNNIYGILYAGIITNELKLVCDKINCLLWYETKYICKNYTKNEDDVPIIQIIGERSDAFEVAKRLKEVLSINEYSGIVVSNIKQSYIEGAVWFSQGLSAKNIITDIICEFKQISYILFCGTSDFNCDIQIDITKNDIKASCIDGTLNIKRQSSKYAEEIVDFIKKVCS